MLPSPPFLKRTVQKIILKAYLTQSPCFFLVRIMQMNLHLHPFPPLPLLSKAPLTTYILYSRPGSYHLLWGLVLSKEIFLPFH